jgi:hypothetical protein
MTPFEAFVCIALALVDAGLWAHNATIVVT